MKGLTARYSEAVHNQRIQKAEIEIMRKKRNILVVSMLLLFAAIAAAASTVMYRRKNRFYRRVAKQYHESNATQSRLRAEIESLREARQSNAAIDKEKSENLFNRLERLRAGSTISVNPQVAWLGVIFGLQRRSVLDVRD